MTTTRQRDTFFDGLKFVLIVLVIFRHTMEGNIAHNDNLFAYTYGMFYHMPLFTFVSGYFCSKKKDLNQFFKGILRLLETLICFSVPYVLLSVATGSANIKLLLVPGWTLWYLLSLMWWRILIQLLPDKILSNKTLMISASVLISILSQTITADGNILSYQRSLGFLPFFVLGYCAKTTDWVNKIKKSDIRISICVLTAMLCGFIFLKPDNMRILSHLLYLKNYYIDFFGNEILSTMLMRAVILVLDIVMSACVMNICTLIPTSFANYGRKTMLFYVYHGLIIYLLLFIFRKLNLTETYPLISSVIIFIIVILLLFAMDKCRIFHLLTNPVSNFSEIIKLFRNKKSINSEN